ncbi:MAG: indolepyruvate ferredoxin oxidoreductase subunit alpha [Treponema sp.]|jgi:indolepyruvate ferredoxin oxidoreductase alpha subunit|nr:indolepyruvate ferredoxin oxidoreductase subunit alpha [Treponema sp.]
MQAKTELLMGNEAVALGAIRAGISVATGYPGTPSTEILETIAKRNRGGIYVEWSVNEKTALEIAAAASMAGARAMVTMKQVGLNVASDPLMSLNYLGVQGGLVIACADDPGPISSQTEQDTRRFAAFAKLAVFDPASPEEAFLMTAAAFDFSEKYRRPVILRPTTRICHAYAAVELLPPLPGKKAAGFNRQGETGVSGRWVIFPSLVYKNHAAIEAERKLQAAELSGGDYVAFNRLTVLGENGGGSGAGCKGIAAGGVTYEYAMEALEDGGIKGHAAGCKVLKIGAFPFPQKLALEFLAGLDEVLVLEELDPVIEDELLKLCGMYHLPAKITGKLSGDMPHAGEYSVPLIVEGLKDFFSIATNTSHACADVQTTDPCRAPSLTPPPRPPVLCAGCPHRASFFAVKEAVREKGRKAVFSGDIGCYTLGNVPPLDMVDTCLCMGAGLSIPQGLFRVEPDTLHFGFVGDSTFFHTGIPGLVNAVYNRAEMIAVILDNFTTAMTGNQVHPGTGKTISGPEGTKINIPAIAAALGIQAEQVNPFNLSAAKAAVNRAIEGGGVRAIIFEAPCIAITHSQSPCAVSAGTCTGCGICVKKLGCPALNFSAADNGAGTNAGKRKAVIEPALCTGCGICRSLCTAGAIR